MGESQGEGLRASGSYVLLGPNTEIVTREGQIEERDTG